MLQSRHKSVFGNLSLGHVALSGRDDDCSIELSSTAARLGLTDPIYGDLFNYLLRTTYNVGHYLTIRNNVGK